MSLVERDGLLVEPCGYAGCSVCDADESSPDVSADLSDVEWAEYDSLTEAQDRTCQANLSTSTPAMKLTSARRLARIEGKMAALAFAIALGVGLSLITVALVINLFLR